MIWALLSGCLSLDFMFLDAPRVDAYTFDPDIVPPELTEAVTFDRGDGTRLAGVWLRQDAEVASPPLVFFHGNGSNVETELERIAFYWSWGGYDVFAPDYSGYGASEGEASWENLAGADGHAALRYVSEATGVSVDDIPVVALSLGGFVALHTADDLPPRALVLESVFASSDLLVDRSLRLDVPPGWFFAADWENDRAIGRVRVPVLVIHGLADDYIDPVSGEILFEAANDPKQLWQPEGVGHADLYELRPDEYRNRATSFVEAEE